MRECRGAIEQKDSREDRNERQQLDRGGVVAGKPLASAPAGSALFV